jgi:hypothetical protein
VYLLRRMVLETMLQRLGARPPAGSRAHASSGEAAPGPLATIAFELGRRRSGAIRASDAEREEAVACLQHHYTAGRLDHDELDARVEAAYAARTLGELEPLLLDLPREAPAPAPRRARRPARTGAALGVLGLTAVLCLVVLAALPEELAALLLVLTVSLAALALLAILPLAIPAVAVLWVIRWARDSAQLRPGRPPSVLGAPRGPSAAGPARR